MRNKTGKNPSPAAAFARAGEILSRRENRLTLIEGLILLVILVPFHTTLHTLYRLAVAIWVPEDATLLFVGVSTAYGFLTAALLVFLSVPAVLGYVHMAGEMARGEQVPLITMFYPFSSGRRYSNALYLSSLLFGRIGLAVIALIACRDLLFFCVGETLAVRALSGLAMVVVIVVVCLLSLRHFTLTAKLDSISNDAEAEAFIPEKRDAFRYGFAFFISYVPWLLLGLLTIGILTLWDTLPRMAVAYFCYTEEIDGICRTEAEAGMNHPEEALAEAVEPRELNTNNMIQSEEDTNE